MIKKFQDWRIKMVTANLLSGAVIAYPTEAVWGLGCIPDSKEAVARILSLKNRSWRKGLILVASEISQVLPYVAPLSELEQQTLTKAWPGPVTFLLPKSRQTPDWISGQSDKVAVRVSSHQVIKSLCDSLKGPLVSTSANLPGRSPAKNIWAVKKYFPSGVDYIFPGRLGDQTSPSEIRDLTTGEIIRSVS